MNTVYKVLVLVLCCTCLYNVTKKWNAIIHQKVTIDSLSQRLDFVRHTTKETATIGFYSNIPGMDSSKNYFQAQLLLAPRIVVRNVKYDTVIAITRDPFAGLPLVNYKAMHQSTIFNTNYTLYTLTK